MPIRVEAVDPYGKAVRSSPMSEKDALLEVWKFKTSGYTQIRTVRVRTNEEINIVRKAE